MGTHHAILDLAQFAIVPQDNRQAQPQLYSNTQLLHGIVKAVIAYDRQYWRTFAGNRAPDGGRCRIAQRAKPVGMVPMCRRRHVPDLLRHIGELGHVGIDHCAFGKGCAQSVTERHNARTLRVDLCPPMRACPGHISSLPTRRRRAAFHTLHQRLQKQTCVHLHRQLRALRIAEHFGVNVHTDHRGRMTQMGAPDVDLGQFGAHYNHQIGTGDDARTVWPRKGRAKKQRIIRRHNPATRIGDKACRPQRGHDRTRSGSRLCSTAAEDEQRLFRSLDPVDVSRKVSTQMLFRLGRSNRHRRWLGHRLELCNRYLNMFAPRARAGEFLHRTVYQPVGRLRAMGGVRPVGHRTRRNLLILHLVQLAAPRRCLVQTAGDHQHRHRIAISLTHRRHHIAQARACDHIGHPRLA